jgi:hypothetical protein
MRGSFGVLAGQVRRLHACPLDGGLYLSIGRNRRHDNALWCDHTGGAPWGFSVAFSAKPARARHSAMTAGVGDLRQWSILQVQSPL